MASKQTVYMNQGQDETSYARNSGFQSALQNRMKPMIQAAIVDLCSGNNTLLPNKVLIADLGCSSGPNALASVSTAIEAIHNDCFRFKQAPPEVCVLLNDLPDNDFNTVVKSLVTLYQSNNSALVTVGVIPGSFYKRLFTSSSLHLFCSSNSLNWLSKAPEDLVKNRIPAYDVDEHARRERAPMVLEAYAHQFSDDFTSFLQLRAKELAAKGHMVISVTGMRYDDRSSKSFHVWEMLAKILNVMALEGIIERAEFESFYVPVYGPSDKEMREIIQEEGSFSITDMRMHDVTHDADITASSYANRMRATFEPIVVQHFGEVMDDFVRTAERRWSLEGSLRDEVAKLPTAQLVVLLTKKA